MRAVNLVWSLENTVGSQQIVAIISQGLSSENTADVREACEAFGVLWRLTGIPFRPHIPAAFTKQLVDDNMLPGFRLKLPMMIVLDTLKSEDSNLRRIGETWMRCSLKSYTRWVPFVQARTRGLI